MPRLALLLLPVLLIPSPSSAQASKPAATTDVTIYRCTNASGALTLRDSPCLKGEQQDVRTMQRPRDPSPSAQPPAPTPTPAAPVPNTTVQVVYLTPPRPLYECVTPDGETYTSDDGEGNPRWVPYWSAGYPAWPRDRHTGSASVSGNVSIGNGTLSFQSGDPRPPRPPHPPRPGHGGAGYAPGGVWIRDTCHALPQSEVCARLSDRRYEILRRYGSAMSSERRALDLEQRDIDARIANDCRNP